VGNEDSDYIVFDDKVNQFTGIQSKKMRFYIGNNHA